MRNNLFNLLALCQVGNVIAFPATAKAYEKSIEERQGQKGGFPEPKPGFDPEFQHVSIEGKHRFIAPDYEAGDVRGPCPGLNAMANHGYLPRNGVGNAVDFIQGTFDAFGMDTDLATILTTLGQTLDGDGVKWSIGGPSKFIPSPLPGVLGTPQGISGSHNKYEADVSPGRGDLYKYGNDFTLQMEQFKELYEMGQARGNEYSLETLREFRAKRFKNSVETNPYFFNGPFTGLLVAPAAFEFIYRFMSNKSEAHPRGKLEGNVLLSFFGVTKDKHGNLQKHPGHEKFPYNWYKRARGDAYGQQDLNEDTLTAALANPEFASVGGNTGKVNSFKGINPKEISGGVFNSKNLLKGNNMACFALGFQAQASPDLVKCSKVLGKATNSLGKLQSVLGDAMAALNCPQMSTVDSSQFEQFPGYSKLSCKTGTYET